MASEIGIRCQKGYPISIEGVRTSVNIFWKELLIDASCSIQLQPHIIHTARTPYVTTNNALCQKFHI